MSLLLGVPNFVMLRLFQLHGMCINMWTIWILDNWRPCANVEFRLPFFIVTTPFLYPLLVSGSRDEFIVEVGVCMRRDFQLQDRHALCPLQRWVCHPAYGAGSDSIVLRAWRSWNIPFLHRALPSILYIFPDDLFWLLLVWLCFRVSLAYTTSSVNGLQAQQQKFWHSQCISGSSLCRGAFLLARFMQNRVLSEASPCQSFLPLFSRLFYALLLRGLLLLRSVLIRLVVRDSRILVTLPSIVSKTMQEMGAMVVFSDSCSYIALAYIA